MEAVRLGPAETEADAQGAHLGCGVHGARIFGDVQTGNTDLAGDANHTHQRVEHSGRSLVLGAFMAMATRFEAYAVNRAVDFRLAQQGGDLLVQRSIQRQVGDLETLRLGVSQTGRVEVTDDDHCSAQQARRSGSRQTDRAGASDVHRAAWADAGGNRAVVASGQDVRQAGQIADLFHRLVAIGQLEQVEVGVGDQHVFGLAAGPVTHVDIAVSTAGTRRVDGQADAGVLFLTGTATAAGNVERNRDQVADLQVLDIAAFLDDFPGDLVTEHQADLGGSAAAHHVLVRAANVGGNDAQDHSVLDLAPAGVLHFRIVDFLDFDLACAEVNDATIVSHLPFSFVFVNTRRDGRSRGLVVEL